MLKVSKEVLILQNGEWLLSQCHIIVEHCGANFRYFVYYWMDSYYNGA